MTLHRLPRCCTGLLPALALVIAALTSTGTAMAQAPAAAPAPVVRAELLVKQPLLVGQQAELQVQILAPNFFTSAPPFPAIELPGAIVTMPDERGRNLVEQIDGQTYAGIVKSYLFTAQQAGDFTLPPAVTRFSYAGADGKPVAAQVQLPPLHIRVQQPAGATPSATAAGQATQPVARLQITQTFDRPVAGTAVHLQVGDALVRTVEVFAEMAQAMLIPPPHFEAPDGVHMFQADPQLSDASPSGGFAGGHRIDKVTYVFERTGSFSVPAVSLDWYDAAAQKTRTAQAPAVQVVVTARAADAAIAPTAAPVAVQVADSLSFWRRIHGWRWLGAFVGVVLAVGLLRPWLARRLPRWRAAAQQREAQRRASEPVMFEAVQTACRADDAPRAYEALLHWARSHLGSTPQAWAAQRQDAALARELTALERRLFAPATADAGHSLQDFASALAAARTQWLAADPVRAARASALPPLNPVG